MLPRIALMIAALTALVMMAACTPGRQLAFGTVPARAASVPHPNDESRVMGYNRAIVRTTVGGLPATGALCRMVAPNMSLEFFTPAEITVPVMRRPLAPATLRCRFGDARGEKVFHAQRVAEMRDDDPDIPFGFALGKLSAVTAGTLNMWAYFKLGSTVTLELAPQRSGGME